MGSKNIDGSDITQGRKTVRKIGGATTFSSDRSETDIQADGVVEPGTGVDSITVQYSTTSQGDAVKTSTNDGLVYRDDDGEIVSLAQDDIDPYTNGAGGSVPTLEQVLAAGSIGPAGGELGIKAGSGGYAYISNFSDTAYLLIQDDGSLTLEGNSTTLGATTTFFQGISKGYRRYIESVTLANLEERTLTSSSGNLIVVKGTGTRTVKLPSSPSIGLEFNIKDGDGTATSGNIAITPLGGKLIDGAASGIIDTNYESRTVVYNGSEWNNI